MYNATRTCTIDGCRRGGQITRGLCSTHHSRMTRHGSTYQSPGLSTAERLQAGIVESPSGCHEWTKATNRKGYGRIWSNGETVYTHRLAWELSHGWVPDDLQVLHRCDNPPCCNPAHLFLGTNADNMADKVAKGRGFWQKTA